MFSFQNEKEIGNETPNPVPGTAARLLKRLKYFCIWNFQTFRTLYDFLFIS